MLPRFCKHTSLPFVYYSAFFLKKDGTKKAFRASCAGPEAYPAYDVQIPRAAVYDFLPLRMCDEMRLDEIRLLSSRTHAIGHRGCNPSFIL